MMTMTPVGRPVAAAAPGQPGPAAGLPPPGRLAVPPRLCHLQQQLQRLHMLQSYKLSKWHLHHVLLS
jgi:hypothetical protein